MTARRTRAPRAVPGPLVREPDTRTPKLRTPKLGTPKLRTRELWWRLAFGVAVAVQLIAVYSPQGLGGPGIPGLDKVVHALIFFAPAFAVLMMGIRARWALGILALHAPVSELIQHVGLVQRRGDVFDVLADLSGVALGWAAYVVWKRRHP